MVLQTTTRMTVDDFERFITQPENSDMAYEFIGGEIVTVVSNNYCSQIAMLIGAFITLFVKRNQLGQVTGADGGYIVNGERYIPDVGYISKQRQPTPNHDSYNPQAPDLAVAVISPTDSPRTLMIKVSNYLASGTTVWIVYPDEREIYVHHPKQGVTLCTVEDTITGRELLPEFTLAVKDIFPEDDSTEETATE